MGQTDERTVWQMDERMNSRTSGRSGTRPDGRMTQTDERAVGQMDGPTDGQKNGWIYGRIDARTDGWTEELVN